jgi:hypothetical protein
MRPLRVRLPREAAEVLGVRPGEKVIGWARTPAGYAIATIRALYATEVGGRLPWHAISKASWDPPQLSLIVVDQDGVVVQRPDLDLEEPRDLPAAVHDRVRSSVVVSERVDLGDGAVALIAARRDSDDGTIGWSVVFDPGLDPTDPELRQAANDAVARMRDSLGI